MLGKTLAELQSNISISAQNAVTGTLLWVDDYTGFSGDPAEQSGNYIALKISAEALGEELEGATITATYHGRTVTLDSDQIIIVRQAEGEDSITFTANKEGYTEGRLTLDLSGLTLQEELVKIAVAGRSPGVMITPILPQVSGSSISIIGRVPWNTTTNRNECAYRVFINRLSAVGTNNLVRIYYNSANPVVLATGVLTDSDGHGAVIIDTPMPAAAIADGTIYFEVQKLDSNNQVVATYTIEADASALTLEPQPNPEVNITSNTNTISITPATYSATKTATGTLQWNPNNNRMDYLGICLEGNAYVSSSRYTITVYPENDPTTVLGQKTNQRLTNAFNMDCNIAAYIGVASYLTVAFTPNDVPSITIDISGLTATDGKITPSGITYQGQTYSASDFISGGTVTRTYSNTTIDGATIKYATVNGVDGYYLAFSIPYTKYSFTTDPQHVYTIPTTADYEALIVDTNDFPSVNLIHFLGNAPANITINISYLRSDIAVYDPIQLKFTNCTFETPAPAGPDGIEIAETMAFKKLCDYGNRWITKGDVSPIYGITLDSIDTSGAHPIYNYSCTGTIYEMATSRNFTDVVQDSDFYKTLEVPASASPTLNNLQSAARFFYWTGQWVNSYTIPQGAQVVVLNFTNDGTKKYRYTGDASAAQPYHSEALSVTDDGYIIMVFTTPLTNSDSIKFSVFDSTGDYAIYNISLSRVDFQTDEWD